MVTITVTKSDRGGPWYNGLSHENRLSLLKEEASKLSELVQDAVEILDFDGRRLVTADMDPSPSPDYY